MKKFSSELLLSREDFFSLKDYKFKWFLPAFLGAIALLIALSPLIKGVGFLPIFIILFLVFAAATIYYYLLNKNLKAEADNEFKNTELIKFNIEFFEDNIKVVKNGKEFTLKYQNIIKLEEYENFYLIYTNNEAINVLPIKKDIGIFTDGSDFIEFIFKSVKLKQKKVKKIRLRKQIAFITIIVLAILTLSVLTPILYSFSYWFFDYGKFGIR